MDLSRLTKAIFTIILLAIVSITLSQPPASTYEASIYSGYPIWYWGLFTLLFVTVSVCLLFNIAWRTAFAVGIAGHILYLGLPLVRGYYLFGRGHSDVLAHLGFVTEIQQYGVIDIYSHNFYPITHTLIYSVSEFTGIETNTVPMILTVLFTPIFVVGLYLYAQELFTHEKALSVTAFAIPLSFSYFHHTLHPSILSFFLLPMLLWSFEVCQRRYATERIKILVPLVLAFAILLFHPMTAVFAIVAVGASTVYYSWERRIPLRQSKSTSFFLLVGLLFSAWYLFLPRTLGTISRLMIFLAEGGQNIAESETAQAEETVLTGIDFIVRAVDLYGLVFLLFIISSVAALYYAARYLWQRDREPEVFATSQLGLGVLMTVGLLIGFVVPIAPIRAARYVILFAIILCGIFAYDIRTTVQKQTNQKAIVSVALIVIIIIAMPMSVTSYSYNDHLTKTESTGGEWVDEYRNTDFEVHSNLMGPKLTMYHQGHNKGMSDSAFIWGENSISKNLGYHENATVGETYRNQSYLVLKDHDRRYHEPYPNEQSKQLELYDKHHIDLINEDLAANRLYYNSGFDIRSISSD